MKPKILVLLAHYLPAVKSGGPIRSISNLVEALGDEMDFYIVTSDREKDDRQSHPGIRPNVWTDLGKARVLYLSPEQLKFRQMFHLLTSQKADILYVNSFFAKHFSILPLLARAVGARGQKQLVLAPRGEFSPGALQFRSGRKQIYVGLARSMRVYRDLVWHASSPYEEQDIRRVFGPEIRVRVALPFPMGGSRLPISQSPGYTKIPGTLRVVFLSRIVPKKNLLGAIRMLNGVSGRIEFNIYGPAEDAAYRRECQTEIDALPENVRVDFRSMVEHSEVTEVLSSHHLFIFPTFGENYGHVIYEALSAGCLVLISDRTPWRGLEPFGAGWDLPLDRPELFRAAIEQCVAMTDTDFQTASAKARVFSRSFSDSQSLLDDNRAVFAQDKPGNIPTASHLHLERISKT